MIIQLVKVLIQHKNILFAKGNIMIEYLSLSVNDYEKNKAFYQKVLKPLGYELLMENEG